MMVRFCATNTYLLTHSRSSLNANQVVHYFYTNNSGVIV